MRLLNLCWIFLGITNYHAVAFASEAIVPIEKPAIKNSAQVSLGKSLFNNKLFDNSQQKSCSSCHTKSQHNLYNVVLNRRFFIDGRAKNISEVIDEHIQDKNIFNHDWNSILNRLNQDQVANTDPQPLSEQGVKAALKAYLTSLIAPSRFDAYLLGEQDVLSSQEMTGYKYFKEYGCETCHQGPNIGGNLYQKMGVYEPYFANKQDITKQDLGRFNITGKEKDKFVYRVPSLRNIALKTQYFHDGSAKTLKEALAIMGKPKIGNDIPERDYEELIAFLQSLTSIELEEK